MSYLDEGPRDGEVVVMLHGNPSWSYLWRHLVSGLADRYRCIVPDHIGMGLSDKPDDAPDAQPRYDYTLQSRVDDLDTLLRHLGITGPVTLAVHDWGGMIGFGWALSHHAQVKRLVITNTAAFPLPAEKADAVADCDGPALAAGRVVYPHVQCVFVRCFVVWRVAAHAG